MSERIFSGYFKKWRKLFMCRLLIGILCLGLITVARAGDGTLKSDPTAKLFGSHPDIGGVRLSPDGSKLLMLNTHPDGYITLTRLVGVNADGTEVSNLLEDRLQGDFGLSQIQTNIIDWLGDDPNHVLIQIPKERGTGG